MTPFANVPKSTQARSTSMLLHTVFGAVLSCLVPMSAKLCHKSSTFKVNFITLGNYRTHATMFNTFAPDVLSSLQNKKMSTCIVYQLWILVYFRKHWAQYTSQFKVQIYAVRYPADNARLQLRYLFGFHSLLFHINKIHLVNASNQMIHPKRHWDYKSFMMPKANKSVKSLRRAPSCIRTKRFQLLEPFEILQFYKSSYTVARVARLIFSKKPKLSKNKAKNG